MASVQLSATSKALHWSAIRDLVVASDIAGAGASGEFSGIGAPPEQIYGAAIGVPGAKAHSGYGMFTDNNANSILIATESRQAWGLIKGKNLLGRDPYIFHLERNMGSGGAFEANAFMMSGRGERFGGYAGWIDSDDSERGVLPGLTLEPYSDFPSLLTQIENTGRKFDRPIVILNSGEPVTIGSILSKLVSIVLAIAKPFAALVGIPSAVFDIIAGAVNIIATQGKFPVSVLGDAVQLMLPVEYRSLIPQATTIYGSISKGDYLGAMDGLGITGNVLGAKNSLFNGDISALLDKSVLPYKELIGKVGNLFSMDTIKSIAAASRSGSVITNLIDRGTMTEVPVLQNLLIATTSDALPSALPGVAEVFEKSINETNDIANVDLHKGAIQMSLGQPVGSDTFDDLGIRALTERANDAVEKGVKRFVMPIVIPAVKRADWAQKIADTLQIQVIADAVEGGITQPNYTIREWK